MTFIFTEHRVNVGDSTKAGDLNKVSENTDFLKALMPNFPGGIFKEFSASVTDATTTIDNTNDWRDRVIHVFGYADEVAAVDLGKRLPGGSEDKEIFASLRGYDFESFYPSSNLVHLCFYSENGRATKPVWNDHDSSAYFNEQQIDVPVSASLRKELVFWVDSGGDLKVSVVDDVQDADYDVNVLIVGGADKGQYA